VAYDGSTTIYVAEGTEGSTGGLIQMFNASGASLNTQTTISSYTFSQPNGVACYISGGVTYIYVLDQVNEAVYEINTSGWTLVTSVPLTSWSPVNGGPGSFSRPEGIAVDSSGNVYVADTGNDYVEVFNFSPPSSASPTVIAEFNGSTSTNGVFDNPSAVAIDSSGKVYVVDASNQFVKIFNPTTYTYASEFWTVVSEDSDIYGITLDSSNNIYLADSGASQIEEYTSTGTFITSGLGNGPTFPDPVGLVFLGTNSNLLAADYANNELYSVTP
jgi:sugar lactone lactonase YvrE